MKLFRVGEKRKRSSTSQKENISKVYNKGEIFSGHNLYQILDHYDLATFLNKNKNIKLYVLKLFNGSLAVSNIYTDLYKDNPSNYYAQRMSNEYVSDSNSNSKEKVKYMPQFKFFGKKTIKSNKSDKSDKSDKSEKSDKSDKSQNSDGLYSVVIKEPNIQYVYINEKIDRLYLFQDMRKHKMEILKILNTHHSINLVTSDKAKESEWRTFMDKNGIYVYDSGFSGGNGSNFMLFLKNQPLKKLKIIAKNKNISLTTKKDNHVVEVKRTTLERRILKKYNQSLLKA